MGLSLSTTAICFIACHAGPADHFAAFAEHLSREGYRVEVLASGPALKKFQDRNIQVLSSFDADKGDASLAAQIARRVGKAAVVLTDVGHPFQIEIQEALAAEAPEVERWVYYDNPEPYVPGGYSATAEKVMAKAHLILFANAHLAKGPKDLGIGYYPMEQAEKLRIRRENEHDLKRKEFFKEHHLEDLGQRLLVYVGGNNEEYFTKAFPAFCKMMGGVKGEVVVLQQHPGAKAQNLDGAAALESGMILSRVPSEEMLVAADVVLYYQTSMGPQFLLAGIPVIQVGHHVYEDILVRNHLAPAATSIAELIKALGEKPQIAKTPLLRDLGIREDWKERLTNRLSSIDSSSASS
jgi:hypothetical protein